jgi:HEPN domain-containing protein
MINVEKQTAYWRNSADEDWEVAQLLVKQQRGRHGLFFAHLALEKMLKAHICRSSGDLPPRLHNLVRLAQLTGIRMSEEQIGALAEMNAFNLEGCYPDPLLAPFDPDETETHLARAAEVLQWLKTQFAQR